MANDGPGTGSRVVLDVSAEEAKEARWGGPSTDTSGGAEEFSESTRLEKGALELVEDDSQDSARGLGLVPLFSHEAAAGELPPADGGHTRSVAFARPNSGMLA